MRVVGLGTVELQGEFGAAQGEAELCPPPGLRLLVAPQGRAPCQQREWVSAGVVAPLEPLAAGVTPLRRPPREE